MKYSKPGVSEPGQIALPPTGGWYRCNHSQERQTGLAFDYVQVNSIIAWQAGQENWTTLVEINRSPSFRARAPENRALSSPPQSGLGKRLSAHQCE